MRSALTSTQNLHGKGLFSNTWYAKVHAVGHKPPGNHISLVHVLLLGSISRRSHCTIPRGWKCGQAPLCPCPLVAAGGLVLQPKHSQGMGQGWQFASNRGFLFFQTTWTLRLPACLLWGSPTNMQQFHRLSTYGLFTHTRCLPPVELQRMRENMPLALILARR